MNTVFIARKGRLHIIEDAVETAKILEKITADGGSISEFEFYERHKPVYYAVQSDGKYEPLKFPEPKEYGLTSPQLYTMAVTYRDAMKKFIEAIIKKKPSLASEVKKLMVIAFPIVIIAFLIFIMVVVMGD
jgi:hypothetical protein